MICRYRARRAFTARARRRAYASFFSEGPGRSEQAAIFLSILAPRWRLWRWAIWIELRFPLVHQRGWRRKALVVQEWSILRGVCPIQAVWAGCLARDVSCVWMCVGRGRRAWRVGAAKVIRCFSSIDCCALSIGESSLSIMNVLVHDRVVLELTGKDPILTTRFPVRATSGERRARTFRKTAKRDGEQMGQAFRRNPLPSHIVSGHRWASCSNADNGGCIFFLIWGYWAIAGSSLSLSAHSSKVGLLTKAKTLGA